MTSLDLPGPPRTYKDILGITMISYDVTMILQWSYKETKTSYDLLGPPKTSWDLPGPLRNYYEFFWFYYDSTMILPEN